MANATGKSVHPVVVRLDVYSGRENPEWPLSAAQTEELLRRYDELPVVAEGPPPFDGLGYRSVSAVLDGGGEIVANRSMVTRGAEKRLDRGRTFEDWLVGTGAGHVSEALLARLRQEMRGAQ